MSKPKIQKGDINMKKLLKSSCLIYVLLIAILLPLAARAAQAEVDRTELPVKGPWSPPITTLDARDAKAPPVFEVKAPKDAPNVVIILLDDLGFGKGGTGALLVDGKEVAKKTLPHTVPFIFGVDESFAVGSDTGTHVEDKECQVPFRFTGSIH